jgi:hypothetical protein
VWNASGLKLGGVKQEFPGFQRVFWLWFWGLGAMHGQVHRGRGTLPLTATGRVALGTGTARDFQRMTGQAFLYGFILNLHKGPDGPSRPLISLLLPDLTATARQPERPHGRLDAGIRFPLKTGFYY